MILQVLIAMAAGWINRHQQHVITYLKEENRVLTSKLPRGRLRLNDTERRRLAKSTTTRRAGGLRIPP